MSKIKVFKFGGASVKDADSIKNLVSIIFNRLQNPTIIVFSAMGKTTNTLENILQLKIDKKSFSSNYAIFIDYHLTICRDLFNQDNLIFKILEGEFDNLHNLLDQELASEDYDEYYDQIICYGEIISTLIIQSFLSTKGIKCIWKDVRDVIATNDDYRFAKIDWDKTTKNCISKLKPLIEKQTVITQGFIGRSSTGKTTTLGREGSDFTASILAYCLHADEVTIWKDVDGVLNADPKRFENTLKFDELDYKEAAELTYYGASVIHPKTIKPLANLGIPLYVLSFVNPEGTGTKIHKVTKHNNVPCIAVKDNQILISFRITDFTFINESHLRQIFTVLEKLNLKVNLLQTSPISVSIVIDEQIFKIDKLTQELESDFYIRYNKQLHLLTIKNHNEALVSELLKKKDILLEQVTRTTFQIVYRLT